METPRTDEHLRMKEENGHVVIVSRDFARQLETELVDKEKQLAEARAEIERLKQIERQALDTTFDEKLIFEEVEGSGFRYLEVRGHICFSYRVIQTKTDIIHLTLIFTLMKSES
jgi:hypothetical protein